VNPTPTTGPSELQEGDAIAAPTGVVARPRSAEEDHLYRGMFANAIWGMFQTTADGRYLSANPALARIYGYASAREMLEAVTDIGSQLYVEPGRRDEFVRLMQQKGYVAGFESQVRRKDGSAIWISETCREVRSTTGEFLYFEGMVEDVSHRKTAERELLVARDLAEAASRTKSAFLANMSHELRTPLNAILGFSEVLQKEIYGRVGDPRYSGYIGNIHDSAQHLLDLINSILDMTRIDAGYFELLEQDVDVNAMLDGCEQMVVDTAHKRGVLFSVQYPSRPIVLRADPARMKQLVLNLLSNAVKFTPKGRAVSASAWLRPDGQFVLQVADNGIGMRPDEIGTALQPFQQIDHSLARRYEGMGLGLSLAKALAEMHQGALTIDSCPSMGTTVTVTLPSRRVVAGFNPALAADDD